MAKKKNKKSKIIKGQLGKKKETAREKMIGQSIGYRYDVNLLPDYKKITPFLKINQVIVKVNKKYFRPSEVEYLLGSPLKAKKKLKWKPKYDFKSLIYEMLDSDLKKYSLK